MAMKNKKNKHKANHKKQSRCLCYIGTVCNSCYMQNAQFYYSKQQCVERSPDIFLGMLAYEQDRYLTKSLETIIQCCIDARIKLRRQSGIDYPIINMPCRSVIVGYFTQSWTNNVELGERAYRYLKSIGYGGTRNDLWLSIYGRLMPKARDIFRAKAMNIFYKNRLLESVTKTKAMRRRAKAIQPASTTDNGPGRKARVAPRSVFIVNTGSTRKVGSHRS